MVYETEMKLFDRVYGMLYTIHFLSCNLRIQRHILRSINTSKLLTRLCLEMAAIL